MLSRTLPRPLSRTPARSARFVAILSLLMIGNGAAAACDSYADDMALASVLAAAVREARANGTLWPHGTVTAATGGTGRAAGEVRLAPEPPAVRP